MRPHLGITVTNFGIFPRDLFCSRTVANDVGEFIRGQFFGFPVHKNPPPLFGFQVFFTFLSTAILRLPCFPACVNGKNKSRKYLVRKVCLGYPYGRIFLHFDESEPSAADRR
jgi:hypothetical protein